MMFERCESFRRRDRHAARDEPMRARTDSPVIHVDSGIVSVSRPARPCAPLGCDHVRHGSRISDDR
jgi:hypothetical protein